MTLTYSCNKAVSRHTFYRYQKLYETGGELALQEIDRRQPCFKNRVEAVIVELESPGLVLRPGRQ